MILHCVLGALFAAGLVSGEAIPVGAEGGLGPLAPDKLFNHPVGAAHALGNSDPDLFVIAGSRFYPDLVVLPFVTRTADGVPVFGKARTVAAGDVITYEQPGTIFESNGETHALWLQGDELVHLLYDGAANAFFQTSRTAMPAVPRPPMCVGWLPDAEGAGFTLLMGISDGTRSEPDTPFGSRDARYDPYDGAGVWRGGFPYSTLYGTHFPGLLEGPATEARRVASTDREVMSSYMRLTRVDLAGNRIWDVIGGSRNGPLYVYSGSVVSEPSPGRMITGMDGVALRHPTIGAAPAAYPDPDGQWCDLIVGGEGALYYYRFTGSGAGSGAPRYMEPTPVLQRDANLYAGSLPVVSVADWNGDGAADIVAGNSEGEILFFENSHSNAVPAFLNGVALEAGGEPISVQAGYSGSIQGPGEARWGYVCPTVVDWSGDGLLDIVMSSALGTHVVYVNKGTRESPGLEEAHPIYLDGLDLHGTWRVQPGVARVEDGTMYVALDDQDEFHLYWQIDVYNVRDGGKLRPEPGAVIGANYLKAGGTGRIKIVLTDWDEDGRVDLLVGTPRHASIPDPEQGLPQALGKPGSAVMLMPNTGSNAAPVFGQPQVLHFRGEPIFFGQHACSPAVAPFGAAGGAGLLVGIETGRLLYFAREDIEFKALPPKAVQ